MDPFLPCRLSVLGIPWRHSPLSDLEDLLDLQDQTPQASLSDPEKRSLHLRTSSPTWSGLIWWSMNSNQERLWQCVSSGPATWTSLQCEVVHPSMNLICSFIHWHIQQSSFCVSGSNTLRLKPKDRDVWRKNYLFPIHSWRSWQAHFTLMTSHEGIHHCVAVARLWLL